MKDDQLIQDRIEELCNVVRATEPPIEEYAVMAIATAMVYIEHCVLDGRQAMPNVTFVKNGKGGIMATEFRDELDGEDKDSFAEMIRNLRRDCEVVIFSTEAWVNNCSPEQLKSGNFVMPRHDPKKQEAGIVQVYLKDRKVSFASFIKRNPTKMQPWEVVFDTTNSDTQDLGGRFA